MRYILINMIFALFSLVSCDAVQEELSTTTENVIDYTKNYSSKMIVYASLSESGELLHDIIEYYDSDDRLNSRNEYTYNELDKKIRTDYYNQDLQLTRYNLYKYADVRFPESRTQKSVYDSLDILLRKTEYMYSEKGNIISEISTDADGNIDELMIRTYHEGEEETFYDRLIFFTANDTDTTIVTYLWDDQGNIVEEKKNDPSGESQITKYTYNDEGRVSEQVNLESINNNTYNIYHYDDQGNIVEILYYAFDNSALESKDIALYTTDSTGDIIVEVLSYDYTEEVEAIEETEATAEDI